MSDTIQINIRSTFDPKGADAARKAVEALRQSSSAYGQVGQAAAKAAAEQAKLAAAQSRITQEAAKAAAAEQRAAAATAQAAAANSRAAAAAAQAARANQQLATETQRTAKAAADAARAHDQAGAAAARRAAAEARAAASSSQTASSAGSLRSSLGSLASTASTVTGALGALGAAAIASQLAQMGAEAVSAANQLEKIQATVRAVAGDANTYAEVLRIAEQNQRLLGGSMAANIEPLQQFLFIANRTGAELEELNRVAQLLAVVNPAEGLAGAGFALSEAFSGDVTSIVERFNLPRQAIRELLEEAEGAGDILAGITDLLADQGVTAETLAAATDTTAASYDRLGAALDNLKTAGGGGLAEFAKPAVDALTALITGNADAEAQLASTSAAIAQSGGSYEQYAQSVQIANAAATRHNSEGIGVALDLLPALTQAQYTHLQALMAEGAGYQEALAQAQVYGQELTILDDGTSMVTESSTALTDAKARLAEATRVAAEASSEQAAQETFLTGEVDAGIAASADAAVARMLQAAEAEKARQAEQDLALAIQEAAGASADVGPIVAQLVAQYGVEASEVYRLIAAYRELMAARSGRGPAHIAGKGGSSARSESMGLPPPPPSGGGGRARGGGGGGRARGGGAGNQQAQQAQRAAEQLTRIQEQAGERIQEINERTGERLAEINEATAEKLIAIDQRSAEERARIAQELADTIAATNANAAANAEVNDLDLVGEDDPKRLAQLEARERAEADAAARREQLAQETAERIAAAQTEEEAAAAQAQYEQQQQYIEQRQALDQRYYERQAELAGNPEALAQLDQQYQEAVTALETARDTELAIEQAKIDAKAAQREAEKAQVLADAEAQKVEVIAKAEEQKQQVIAKAQEQAAGVKNASDAQKQAVADALAAQSSAATDWAAATETAAQRVIDAYADAAAAAASVPGPPTGGGGGGGSGGGGGGANYAAGGGSFVTTGRTTLTLGDNPGGMEYVHVVPLSGKGTSRASHNMVQMGAGGSLLAGLPNIKDIQSAVSGGVGLDPGTIETLNGTAEALASLMQIVADLQALAEMDLSAGPIPVEAVKASLAQAQEVFELLQNQLVPLTEEQSDQIGYYVDAVQGAFSLISAANDIISQMVDLAEQTEVPPPPIDLAVLQGLADQTQDIVSLFAGILVPTSQASLTLLEQYGEAVAGAADILLTMVDLARATQVIPQPINLVALQELAANSQKVGQIVGAVLLPIAEQNSETLSDYGEAVAQSVQILLDLSDLRRELAAGSSPLNEVYIKELAQQTLRVGAAVGAVLVPISETASLNLERYAEAVAASVGLLRDMHALRQELGAPAPPINEAYVHDLANQTRRVVQIVGTYLFGYVEQVQQYLLDYRDTAGAVVGILRDTAALREDLQDVGSPIPESVIISLADEMMRVAMLMDNYLFGYVEQVQEQLLRYQETVGAAVSILRDTASLRQEAAEATTPLPEALIIALAEEARRVTILVGTRLAETTEEQAAGLERYAAAAQAAIGVLLETAALRRDLAEPVPPLDANLIRTLANEAAGVVRIVRERLLPTTEEQAAELERYARAASAAIGVLGGLADLRSTLAQAARSPLDSRMIAALAEEAKRITGIVRERLLPTTEEQGAEIERYAAAAGAAVGTLRGVLDLSGSLFVDYRSPTDVQLQMVADDARRITEAFAQAGAVMQGEGISQAQAFADAASASFGAVQEGLLAINAINSQDFALNQGRLAQWEANAIQVVGAVGRAGAAAAAIDPGHIAALNTVSAAVAANAEAMIRLAAIPMGDVPTRVGMLGAPTGGNLSITFAPGSIVIEALPGMDTQQLADLAASKAVQKIQDMTRSRR